MTLPNAVKAAGDAARELARGLQTPPQTEDVVAEVPVDAPSEKPAEAERAPIDPSDWESRYKALRASRDDRRASLESENQALQSRVAQLEALTQKSQPAQAPAKKFEIDPDAREYLGETEAKLFDQMAESTESRFAEYDQQLEALRQREQRAKQRFFGDLDGLVPTWRSLNENPDFLRWLGETDPATGDMRQSALDGFVDENDAQGAARLFGTFLQGSKAETPAESVKPQPVPEIEPARVQTHESEQVEMYTRDEIKQFYEQKSLLYRTGKLQGERKAQVEADEANIRRAIAEGRVM